MLILSTARYGPLAYHRTWAKPLQGPTWRSVDGVRRLKVEINLQTSKFRTSPVGRMRIATNLTKILLLLTWSVPPHQPLTLTLVKEIAEVSFLSVNLNFEKMITVIRNISYSWIYQTQTILKISKSNFHCHKVTLNIYLKANEFT